MRKKNKSFSGYIADVSAVVTLLGLFFMFASFIGTSMDIRTSVIIMLITVLSASIYIWTLKQEQRRAAQLQEIIRLSQLTQLDLSGKGLTRLPPELFHLTKLTNLEVLNLSGNQLVMFPPEIFELPNLTQLDLSGNQLTALPQAILQLTNLETLNLSGNKLAALPQEIFTLTSLSQLDLSGNQIADLSSEILQLKNLTELDLSGNQFTTLPQEITQLTTLEKLHLKGNPLTSPPKEMAELGIEAVRSYFVSLKEDVQPLNEVKVILVGDGAAGKTSLVKQLLGQPFDQCEYTTHGISIRGWDVEAGRQQIKVNIWDFGGQEIMHATHQFFLSKRSLYVLVLDGRRDERPEYWLRYIEAFGGDSPVLIVTNKQDISLQYNLDHTKIQQEYPNIRRFFRISCKTGTGIAKFKEALIDELGKVPMVGIRWPISWLAVKQHIEQMPRPYISADEYKAICNEAGIAEDSSREVLLDFLHDLGVAVHFNDFILDDMHVLNPVWVTNAVYKIINSEQMADSKGILRLGILGEILSQEGDEKRSYPAKTYPFIIGLMKKFELCYSISEDSILIPQLIPVVEPEFSFDYSGSLRFSLHYHDFLPQSVFLRFIVKAHKDIKDNLRWRTGVVLEDKMSGSEAVIKADTEARRIYLWVNGPRRKEYLSFIWFSLREINSSFEKLAVSERIPMPDDPQVTADYQTLLDCVQDGIERYRPDGAKRTYSVKELLGLVEPDREEQIVELLRMVKAQLDEKESTTETANSLFELKPNIAGISLNVNELFARILGAKKQR